MNIFDNLGRPSSIARICSFAIIAFVLLGFACSGNQPIAPKGEIAEETKNPLTDLNAAASAGRLLYAANCVMCHGEDGKGTGMAGASLPAKPTDLTSGEVSTSPDGKIFLVVKNGKMRSGKMTMPQVSKLTDEQIWQIVAYVRTLK